MKKSSFDDNDVLFPHFSSKNVRFFVNFGQDDKNYLSDANFRFLDNIVNILQPSSDQLNVDGKNDIIMLVSLPESGTDLYTKNYVSQHPAANFYVVSLDELYGRMDSCITSDTHTHIADSKEELSKIVRQCIQIILKIAPTRKRNLIIDQGDIYNGRRRKVISMFPTALFTRIAKVFVLPEESYNYMVENSDVFEIFSEEALGRMKCTFDLPNPSDRLFSQTEYVELDYKSSLDQIKAYKDNSSPKQKHDK